MNPEFDTSPTTAARRALALTGALIDKLGPRPSGSEASRAAADALKAEASSYADDAWTEDFAVHPAAFLGWIRLLVIFYAVAVVLLWLQAYLLAAILTTVGMGIMIGQFFLYRELLDPFFPRRTGRNVLGQVEPAGTVRGQLIISGHHDSARIFNFLANRPSLYPLRVFGGIGAIEPDPGKNWFDNSQLILAPLNWNDRRRHRPHRSARPPAISLRSHGHGLVLHGQQITHIPERRS